MRANEHICSQYWLHVCYSEDSANGSPLVQILVFHLYKDSYELYVVWYCEL